jgi:hypothetical protein
MSRLWSCSQQSISSRLWDSQSSTFSQFKHQLQSTCRAQIYSTAIHLVGVQRSVCCAVQALGDIAHFHWTSGQLESVQLFLFGVVRVVELKFEDWGIN